jgi:uncharacterized membrane protein YbhN (UPF0104 family)
MLAPRKPFKTPRQWLLLLGRWAAAALILALLVYFLPFAPLRAALARVPWTRFAVVLLFYLVALCGGTLKWHIVVSTAGARLRFMQSAQCYTSGLFGDLFLPSVIGGDVARLAVGIAQSLRPAAVVTGNVADRFLDLGAQLTLVCVGVLLLPGSLPVTLRMPGRRVLLKVGLGVVVLILLLWALHRPLLPGRSFRTRRRIAQVRHAIRMVARRPQKLALGWLLGISVQGTYVLLTALLGMACGLNLPLRVWLFAWPLAKIAAVVPLTQGGIGVREAALVVLLAQFGAPAALVLATGIVWEGIIIAGAMLAGLTALLLRRFLRRRSPLGISATRA